MSQIKVHGLGDIGMHVISLTSTETTLNHLFQKIEDYSGVKKQNQLLFCSTCPDTITYSQHHTRRLQELGIKHGSDLNFVRNFTTSDYPTFDLRVGTYVSKCLKYFSGAMLTISTVAFLSRMFLGSEAMLDLYPSSLSVLAWWPTSYLFGFSAVCSIVVDVGHWLAGFPIVPAALFTLVNKGTKYLKRQEMAQNTTATVVDTTLSTIELQVVKLLSQYLPSLVHESQQMVDRNTRGIKYLHQNYGGTRVRFVCADGVAVDGMHVPPPKGSKVSGSGERGGGKCYIVVNGNAEFFEMDGLYQQQHSNSARYRSLGFHVLLFNYRGVGMSEGAPSRDGLVLDLHAVVQYALDPLNGLGIDASNVVVCGRSLGGAVSTMLLSKMVHVQPNLILCNTRSFSTLRAAATKLLSQNYGERVGNGAALGIKLLGWEMNAYRAWLTLVKEAPNGYRWIESVGNDDIILPGAKLLDRVTEGNGARVIQLDCTSGSGHNRALKSSEYQKRLRHITEGLSWNVVAEVKDQKKSQ